MTDERGGHLKAKDVFLIATGLRIDLNALVKRQRQSDNLQEQMVTLLRQIACLLSSAPKKANSTPLEDVEHE